MALNANAIITLAEAKAQLNLSSGDVSADTQIESWINESSSIVEDYCGRKIVVQSVSGEILDGDGSRFLYPKYFPVTQLSTETSPTTSQKLSALQYRDTPDSTWTDFEDNINYLFIRSDKPFIESYETAFPLGIQNIKISYKAGFSTVPSDIKKVVLEMVQIWRSESIIGENSLGKSQTNLNAMGGNMNVSFLDMDKRWKVVLDRYRIISME